MPNANDHICACGHWYHLHIDGACRTCGCTRVLSTRALGARYWKARNERAEDILRGLVDAVAGEQEDPGELARALGREAPHWIARARALLREREDHGR